MTTTAYLRISTDQQADTSQRQIIDAHAATHGLTIDHYVTDCESGSTPWERRNLKNILDLTQPGDLLIVSEISRLARSTIGVLGFLQEAAAAGLSVRAVRSGIALDGSASSKIVVTVLAMAAEIERDLLRERTRAALEARRAAGLPLGRPPANAEKRN